MLFSQKLRLLASYLEDHPMLNERHSGHWDYPGVYINAEDTADFGELCRAMGKFEKERNNYSDSISACYEPTVDNEKYGDTIFRVAVSVSGVCEKVPRLNEDGTPVTRTVTRSKVIEEVSEQVPEYDWKCPDAWLNL